MSDIKSLQEINNLIKVYEEAKKGLIRTIAEKEIRGNVNWFQKSLLNQINVQITDLNKKAKNWVENSIPNSYQHGLNKTNEFLLDIGLNSFAKLHTRAIEALVLDTMDDLFDANQFAENNIKKVIKNAVDQSVIQKISQGQTIEQCKKIIISKLMGSGIVDGVESSNGRLIPLDSYAALVARSRTREATNTAIINQLTSNKYDLVKMSKHNSSCPICSVYQGRVFSISGNDKRYPPLKLAFRGPYANIHPNCSHVIMPYIEELAFDPEEDRKFSNLPFDVDSRSQKQIDLYNESRRKKQKLRENRRQWERYSLVMPKDTPRTFQGFMSLKRSNNERWNNLQKLYREQNKKLKE